MTLSGTIEIAGWSGGPIRIDVFDGDQVAAAGSDRRPNVVAQARLEKPGVFAVSVPVSANKVWIGAFADEDRDGKPGREDPSGWYGDNPVDLGADRGGLALKISRPEPPPSGGLQ